MQVTTGLLANVKQSMKALYQWNLCIASIADVYTVLLKELSLLFHSSIPFHNSIPMIPDVLLSMWYIIEALMEPIFYTKLHTYLHTYVI